MIRRGRPLFYLFAQAVAFLLCVLFWGLRVRGMGHVPREGGAVLICNHQSFLDLVFLGCSFPRALCFVARRTLRAGFLYRMLTWPFQVVHLRSDEPDVSSWKEIVQILKRGRVVLIFPEGSRTAGGSVGAFRMGFFAASRRAGVPIVPARIRGSFEAWPRGRTFPRWGRVRIQFHPPRFVGADRDSFVERLRRELYS